MKKDNWYIVLIILALLIVALSTKFYGGADIYDYADVAKFFSGKYMAKIRTSHSFLYGFIHTPFISFIENYFIFKITSIIFLLLIVYSVYSISGKDKRALWLVLLSPIIWYMAPWISPIQLASFLFLWGYYFIKRFDVADRILYLFYSGALIGLSWAFWDGVLFFIPLFLISYFYNKKVLDGIYFIIFIFIGVLPRLILDQVLLGFAFFGIIRHVIASFALVFGSGLYNQEILGGFSKLIFVAIFIPFYSFLIFRSKILKENKKTVIFLIFSIIVLIFNSQIRFVLLILPIIILTINKYLTKKQFITQIVIFIVISLLVINPYIIQIKYEIEGKKTGTANEFGPFVMNIPEIGLSKVFNKDLIRQDLEDIANEFPNETFVIGNYPDDYQVLADIYWGRDIKEFVSIEDYRLFLTGNGVIAEREICSRTKIANRRDFCFSITLRKAFNDKTDYESIRYGISLTKDLNLSDFKLVKKYRTMSIYEKI